MAWKNREAGVNAVGDAVQNIWVTAYSDMITNLMILFMILWAYTQFIQKEIAKPAPQAPASALQAEIKDTLEEVGAVVVSKRKVTVTLSSAVLFDPGSDDLRAGALESLAKVASALARSTAPVVVEGHTDDVPIRVSRWRSNHELSAARAFSVIRYFTKAGIPPGRLAARGFGPYRPVVPNESDEQRSRNRRIEIHLWTS